MFLLILRSSLASFHCQCGAKRDHRGGVRRDHLAAAGLSPCQQPISCATIHRFELEPNYAYAYRHAFYSLLALHACGRCCGTTQTSHQFGDGTRSKQSIIEQRGPHKSHGWDRLVVASYCNGNNSIGAWKTPKISAPAWLELVTA